MAGYNSRVCSEADSRLIVIFTYELLLLTSSCWGDSGGPIDCNW